MRKKLPCLPAIILAWSGCVCSVVSLQAAPPNTPPESDAYRLVVLAGKPTAYWRLGEAAGARQAHDETGNSHHGEYKGDPKLGSPGALKLSSNASMTLDSTSYVEIANDPLFSQPTSGEGLTVEVWLRPDRLDFADNGNDSYIHWLGKGGTGEAEWGFRFYTKADKERSNRISAYIWNLDGGLGAGAYSQTLLKVGEWIYLVACYEPGDATTPTKPGVRFYKNGSLQQAPPNPGTLYENPPEWSIMPKHGTAPVRLGKRDDKTGLVGGLDEVAIYPRILSAQEIQLHYQIATGARKLTGAEWTKLRQLAKPK